MEILKPTINFDRFVRGLLFIAAMTVFVLVLRWLSPVLIPFFAAWAIAWILAPVVHFFQHTCRLRSRVVAVLMTLTLLTAMATVVVWLMIPPLVDGITQIKDASLSYLSSGHIRNVNLPSWLDHLIQQWLDQAKIQSLLRSDNALGHGNFDELTDVVYVKTDHYSAGNNPLIADEIEQLNARFLAEGRNYVLIGPGRWGSSDPWLGIPVKWPAISAARIIVEAVLKYPDVMHEVLIAAAFLSAQSPFVLPPGEESDARKAHHAFRDMRGDFMSYVKIFNAYSAAKNKSRFCENGYLDERVMAEIANIKEQLEQIVSGLGLPILSGGEPGDYFTCGSSAVI